MLTTVGMNLLRDLIVGVTSTRATYLAPGSSSTAATEGDTTLGTEVMTRIQGAYSTQNKQVILAASVGGTEWTSSVIREIGLFTASTSGIMEMRQTFADLLKPASPAEVWRVDVAISMENG